MISVEEPEPPGDTFLAGDRAASSLQLRLHKVGQLLTLNKHLLNDFKKSQYWYHNCHDLLLFSPAVQYCAAHRLGRRVVNPDSDGSSIFFLAGNGRYLKIQILQVVQVQTFFSQIMYENSSWKREFNEYLPVPVLYSVHCTTNKHFHYVGKSCSRKKRT